MRIKLQKPVRDPLQGTNIPEQMGLSSIVSKAYLNSKPTPHPDIPGRSINGNYTSNNYSGGRPVGIANGTGNADKMGAKTRLLRFQNSVLKSFEELDGDDNEFSNRLWAMNTNAMLGLVGKMLPRHSEMEVSVEQKAMIIISDAIGIPNNQDNNTVLENLPAKI